MLPVLLQLSLSAKCVSFAVASGTIVMLASAVHIVAKYYQRPKHSLNKIQILQKKFEFGKKNEFNIPNHSIRKMHEFEPPS